MQDKEVGAKRSQSRGFVAKKGMTNMCWGDREAQKGSQNRKAEKRGDMTEWGGELVLLANEARRS